MNRRVAAFVAILALFTTLTAAAQTNVPTPDEFLGYGMGERFTPHHRILAYFDELAKKSSLVTIEKIGETYEHRPLVLATITSAKNRAALETIRRNAATLARGEGDVDAIVKDMPVIVWLAFGVHGNESSSAEAAMFVASALLNDPQYSRLLDDTVVIIDPLDD